MTRLLALLLLIAPQVALARGTFEFVGSAESLVQRWPAVCHAERCVPMEAVLTLIAREGR